MNVFMNSSSARSALCRRGSEPFASTVVRSALMGRRNSQVLAKIVADVASEKRIKGVQAVTMLKAGTTCTFLTGQRAASFNVSASVVPCEDGKRNPTFHNGVGVLVDAKGNLKDFLTEQAVHVSLIDLGDPNGLGIDVQRLGKQDAGKKAQQIDAVLKEAGQGSNHNEVVLPSEMLRAPGLRAVLKEHHHELVEQMNLPRAAEIARRLAAMRGDAADQGAIRIVLLPCIGEAAEVSFEEATRRFVAATGVPMDKVADAVRDLARAEGPIAGIELQFHLGEFDAQRHEGPERAAPQAGPDGDRAQALP